MADVKAGMCMKLGFVQLSGFMLHHVIEVLLLRGCFASPKKHASKMWCVLSLEIGGFMLWLKQTILSFKNPSEEMKAAGLRASADAIRYQKAVIGCFIVGKYASLNFRGHYRRLGFWIPITHPIHTLLYICLDPPRVSNFSHQVCF